MTARTKLRLLVLPQLAMSGALLSSQRFLPTGSIFVPLVAILAMAYTVFYLVNYTKLSVSLVPQMKSEQGLKSVGNRSRSVEDRLDELERLKRREMVTPEEYAAKRQEILKDL